MRYGSLLPALATLAVAACSNSSTGSEASRLSLATVAPARAAAPADREPDLAWGPAPAVFPPGAEMVVLQGDPSKAEPFTVRLRFPNNYRVAPHTHPTTENVTVLSGTLLAGMGETFDASAMQALGRDAFASLPANHAHYVQARGVTVVQVHAPGPFAMTYVNPADAPAPR